MCAKGKAATHVCVCGVRVREERGGTQMARVRFERSIGFQSFFCVAQGDDALSCLLSVALCLLIYLCRKCSISHSTSSSHATYRLSLI